MGQKEKEQAIEAAKGTGVKLRPEDTREIDAAAAKFATAQVDYIYEQSPEELFRSLLPKYVVIQIFRAPARIGGGGTRGAHDRHGRGNQQRNRYDRFADPGHESRPPSENYKRNY